MAVHVVAWNARNEFVSAEFAASGFFALLGRAALLVARGDAVPGDEAADAAAPATLRIRAIRAAARLTSSQCSIEGAKAPDAALRSAASDSLALPFPAGQRAPDEHEPRGQSERGEEPHAPAELEVFHDVPALSHREVVSRPASFVELDLQAPIAQNVGVYPTMVILRLAMDLEVGVHVTPNIRLKRPLGEGGMASVWVAEHLSLGIEVAVKFIAPELMNDAPELVARFNREATAIAKIRSPHVVQVLDHGQMGDGTPYIVMELLEGEDLGMRLDRVGVLPMAQVAEIVAQVAKALTRAHATGIIHRDIKPDNLFIVRSEDDEELFVKVLDFGIAKHLKKTSRSVVTTTGTMVGTPAYMSPEQILSGKDVDERADLWSLGVVAYHALTGDVPFQGTTLGALCVAIARGFYEPPSYVQRTLPTAVDGWMKRALAALPAERFQSPKELSDAFREAVANDPAAAEDVGPFSRPSSDCLVAGQAVEDGAWDDRSAPVNPPLSRRHKTPSAVRIESVIVLPTKRSYTRAAVVASGAFAVGIVAAAALIRVGGDGPPAQGTSGPSVFLPIDAQSAYLSGDAFSTSAPAVPSGVVAPLATHESVLPAASALPEAVAAPPESAAPVSSTSAPATPRTRPEKVHRTWPPSALGEGPRKTGQPTPEPTPKPTLVPVDRGF